MMAPCLSATSGLPFAVLAVNVFAVAAWYLSLPPSSAAFGFDDFVKVKGKHVSNKPSVKPTPETGFERFLRAPPDTAPSGVERPSVNAFTSFLKVVAPSVPRAAAVAASPVHPLAGVAAVEVAVLFGTEYGFSREVAAEAACSLISAGLRADVRDLATLASGLSGLLPAPQAVVFVVSTHGDGVPPPEARPFFNALATSSESPPPYAVIALGDRNYKHYCAAGVTLERILGGKPFAARLDVDKEDWVALRAWIPQLVSAVVALQLPPRDPVRVAVLAENVLASPALFGKAHPLWASLVSRESLCTLVDANDKDTVRCEFDISGGGQGMQYLPGDSLGIYARNCPVEVARLLRALCASGNEVVCCQPVWQQNDRIIAAFTLTLREALLSCYDLREPRPALREWIEKHSLLSKPALLVAPGVHISDMLLCAAPFTESVLGVFLNSPSTWLRPLQPRLYSISSSPLECTDRVAITVAVVRYAVCGSPRVGVCSTYVGDRLALGGRVPVFISRAPDFRLPASPTTPIICVGPGTGLAPFRAFLAHRRYAMQGCSTSCDVNTLFFGCRSASKDFLYATQLSAWATSLGPGKSPFLCLHTAFSRQAGVPKTYVQHRLAEQADFVVNALLQHGAHFYVCGDASHMAGDVETTLKAIVATRLPGGVDDAESFIDQLAKSGRYQRDVWYS